MSWICLDIVKKLRLGERGMMRSESFLEDIILKKGLHG